MAHIKAVCFDLGGVLVRIRSQWRDVILGAGVQGRLPDPDHWLGELPEMRLLQDGAIGDDEYLGALCREYGLASKEDALKVHDAILTDAFPGTLALRVALETAGIHTGCLSNTNAMHWSALLDPGRYPAIASLDLHMASHELRLSKPDPAIFSAYAVRAGFDSSQIVLFDDTRSNIDGAVACGWKAQWIDPENDPTRQMREWLVREGVL